MSVSLCRELAVAMRDGSAREQERSLLVSLLLEGGVLDAAEAAMAPELEPAPLLVDTREQRPRAPFIRVKGQRVNLDGTRIGLDVGDYSVPGLERFVAFEWKDPSDLYGTLIGQRKNALGEGESQGERLRREYQRGRELERFPLVTPILRGDMVRWIQRHHPRADPFAVIAKGETMLWDMNRPLVWCNGQTEAEWYIGLHAARMHAQHTDPREAKKARARGLDMAWLKPEGE